MAAAWLDKRGVGRLTNRRPEAPRVPVQGVPLPLCVLPPVEGSGLLCLRCVFPCRRQPPCAVEQRTLSVKVLCADGVTEGAYMLLLGLDRDCWCAVALVVPR